MRFSTALDWLNCIKNVNPLEIELGIDRIKSVAQRLGLLSSSCTVISVAGTNGKGSTVAGLEAIYLTAGYRVGVFNSPILFKHNEYVRINGLNPDDLAFCQAFEQIESARENILLTPFEYYTLAALLLFKKQTLDII